MERSWLRMEPFVCISVNACTCSWEHAGITAEIDPASRILLTPQSSHSFGSWHLVFFFLRIPGDHIGSAPTNRLTSRSLLGAKSRYYMLECISLNGWTTNQKWISIRRRTSVHQEDSPVSRSYRGITFFQLCNINHLGSTPEKMTSDTRIWDRHWERFRGRNFVCSIRLSET